jgi:hypothetical protein
MSCMRLPEVSDSLLCARLAISSTNSSRELARDRRAEGTSEASEAEGDTSVDKEYARIYPCGSGACGSNNTCKQNRTGPLCGVCAPGYSMTTEGCSAVLCPPEEELRPLRILSIMVGAILVSLLWWSLCCRPVVPEGDWIIASLLQGVITVMSSFMCFKDAQGDGADVASECSDLMSSFNEVLTWIIDKVKTANAFWKENNVGQFVKIYVTFLQILGSFSIYSITWPEGFTSAINWVKGTFKFDVVKLPMLSCLWAGVSFEMTLRTYTLGPLIILGFLMLPIGLAWCRRLHIIARARFRETVDRFWTNTMFTAFVLYPALAMTSMSVLNCDPNIGRLRDDYRVVCPHMTAYISLYSYVFMILYPLGIPVVMHVALRVAGIRKVVQAQIQVAELQAMLGLFIKLWVSIEMQRFARLLGNVDDDEEEFERQALKEFKKLLRLQGDGSNELDLNKLSSVEAKTQGMGMEGTSLTGIVRCLRDFDTNGDGKTDFKEFCVMIRKARAKANLFTGAEDVEALSDTQLTALLAFDNWPSASSGPGDIGENEGIGGLLAIANKADGRGEDDSVEERVKREQNIQADGDRSDPELVQIDLFKEEMEKRDAADCDVETPGASILNDVKEAERLYVQDPTMVDACLERMRLKYLSTESKRAEIAKLAHKLVRDRVTSIPQQVWHCPPSETQNAENKDSLDADTEPPKDQQIINRFGFLFIAYRLDFWWWEAMEMARKFLMTTLLVFIKAGTPGQLCAGTFITLFFLYAGQKFQPFCTDSLNDLNSMGLLAQLCTLLVGMMIALLDNMPDDGATSGFERTIISVMVVLVNGLTMVWPLVRKLITGSLQEYWNHAVHSGGKCYLAVCVRLCGSKEAKAKIAATAAKLKNRKEKRKQRLREQAKAEKDRHKTAEEACPLEVPSPLSAVFLEDCPVSAEPEFPALRATDQVDMSDFAAVVFNQPAPSGFVEDRSAQQIDIDIERVRREISEITDRLGIAQLNQPAPQVNMVNFAWGVFNQPVPSEFVGDRSVQYIDSDIERVQREIAEIADQLGVTGLREGVGPSE